MDAATQHAASPGTTSDEVLILDYARGSSEAFAELFERYQQPIFGFFRRRVLDPNHAEELTQETFLAVIHAASRYRPTALFRTYLYAIAMNVLKGHRRRAAFRATFFGAEEESIDRNPGQSAIDTQVILRHALGKLDAGEREILMLREFEQLSYAEIAELLRLPINTVRSRLFRARTALHRLLTTPAPGASMQNLQEERA